MCWCLFVDMCICVCLRSTQSIFYSGVKEIQCSPAMKSHLVINVNIHDSALLCAYMQ